MALVMQSWSIAFYQFLLLQTFCSCWPSQSLCIGITGRAIHGALAKQCVKCTSWSVKYTAPPQAGLSWPSPQSVTQQYATPCGPSPVWRYEADTAKLHHLFLQFVFCVANFDLKFGVLAQRAIRSMHAQSFCPSWDLWLDL